jgi:hypothetical protein
MLTEVTPQKVRHDILSQMSSPSDNFAYPQEKIQERINVQHDSGVGPAQVPMPLLENSSLPIDEVPLI